MPVSFRGIREALINIRGEIIGINKSVLPNAEKNYAGIGFAIPSNLVMHSFEQICKHGRPMKGYLGLDIVRNTPRFAPSWIIMRREAQ